MSTKLQQCPNCGKSKSRNSYKCHKCGWEPGKPLTIKRRYKK